MLLNSLMMERSKTGLPQGLVLQSNDPETIPHIVISPPSHNAFEMYCRCGRCDFDTPQLPPQFPGRLAVPDRLDSLSYLEELPLVVDMESWLEACEWTGAGAGVDAPRVFNPTLFQEDVRRLTGKLTRL